MKQLSSIPKDIWDEKKFGWKLILRGLFKELRGCPNLLYTEIKQLKDTGQNAEDKVYVFNDLKLQYAVVFLDSDNILIYSKK